MNVKFTVRKTEQPEPSRPKAVWCHITYNGKTYMGEADLNPDLGTPDEALEQAHHEALLRAVQHLMERKPTYLAAVETVKRSMNIYRTLIGEDYFESHTGKQTPKTDGVRLAEHHAHLALLDVYHELIKANK